MHDLLERLDDPVPFTVSPDLVTGAKARGAHLRRRRRLGVTGAMVPVILVLALVTGAVYVDHRLNQVDRATSSNVSHQWLRARLLCSWSAPTSARRCRRETGHGDTIASSAERAPTGSTWSRCPRPRLPRRPRRPTG